MGFHRPDQPDAALDLAIVEHDARRRRLHSRPTGALIDQQPRLGLIKPGQSLNERDGPVALAFYDGQQPRLRARAGVDVDGAAVGDDETFRREGLQPGVIDALCNRALDLGRQELLEGGEEHALQLDGERQQPV